MYAPVAMCGGGRHSSELSRHGQPKYFLLVLLSSTQLTVVVNDFAGQRMYYVLHQMMITQELTVYVVVVSLEHDLGEAMDEEDLVYGMTRRQNLEF